MTLYWRNFFNERLVMSFPSLGLLAHHISWIHIVWQIFRLFTYDTLGWAPFLCFFFHDFFMTSHIALL
jgi:hypothetical protein